MIARYLKDFGAPAFPVAEQPSSEDGPFGFPVLAEPEPDPETLRREAYAEGHEAAEAALCARHAAEMAELAERHEAEMAALTERCETQIAELIAGRFASMTAEISASVGDATAEVLIPFLGEAAARRAVSDLAALLLRALEEGEAGRIRLRGPEAAFRRLSELLGEKTAAIDFEASAEVDLTAEIGTSLLVTRLGAFAAGLEKVME